MPAHRPHRCTVCQETGHNRKRCPKEAELWVRAQMVRNAERRAAQGGRRKYPPAKVGDVFGSATVVELLPRGYGSNERVRVRCTCGREDVSLVFNLRKRREGQTCPHGGRSPRVDA